MTTTTPKPKHAQVNQPKFTHTTMWARKSLPGQSRLPGTRLNRAAWMNLLQPFSLAGSLEVWPRHVAFTRCGVNYGHFLCETAESLTAVLIRRYGLMTGMGNERSFFFAGDVTIWFQFPKSRGKTGILLRSLFKSCRNCTISDRFGEPTVQITNYSPDNEMAIAFSNQLRL